MTTSVSQEDSVCAINGINSCLHTWKSEQNKPGFDPIPVLSVIADIIETQTEYYLKQDPDPFDERHPGRVDPNCTLGHVMKVLLKDEDFISKLLDSYLMARDNQSLNVAACRLLLDILPATDVVRVFQETEGLIEELFRWAEQAPDPLKYYACGLLASAMEVQDVSSTYRSSNAALFPVLLRHLHQLKDNMESSNFASQNGVVDFANSGPADGLSPCSSRDFSGVRDESCSADCSNTDAHERFSVSSPSIKLTASQVTVEIGPSTFVRVKDQIQTCNMSTNATAIGSSIRVKRKLIDNNDGTLEVPTAYVSTTPSLKRLRIEHNMSNSSWAELQPYIIGKHRVYPLDVVARQRLVLNYLASIGEYQEFLPFALEHKAMELILYYIDLTKNKDVRLALDALKQTEEKLRLQLEVVSNISLACH